MSDGAAIERAAGEVDRFLRSFSALSQLSATLKDFAAIENHVAAKTKSIDGLKARELELKTAIADGERRLAEATAAAANAEREMAAKQEELLTTARAEAAGIISTATAQAEQILAVAIRKKADMEARAKRISDAVRAAEQA